MRIFWRLLAMVMVVGRLVEAAPSSGFSFSNYLAGGKLSLTLDDYLRLVLSVSPDIQYTLLPIEAASNAVLRSKSVYDPSIQASFSRSRTIVPEGTLVQGASTLTSLTNAFQFAYNQQLPTGTSINSTTSFQGLSDNDVYNFYNPSYSAATTFQITQPLWRNLGGQPTRRSILIAKSAEVATRDQASFQVALLVANAEQIFWDYIQSRETVELDKSLVALRELALDRAQKEVAAGAQLAVTLSQPRSDLAAAELSVVQAEAAKARAETALKAQIGADKDAAGLAATLVIVEPSQPTIPNLTVETAISHAMATRADRRGAAATLNSDGLMIDNRKDAMRPDLSLTASVSTQGLAGTFVGAQYLIPYTPVTQAPVSSGVLGTLGQLGHLNTPSYSAGVQLNLPIRNRSAKADYDDALIKRSQDKLQLAMLERQIRIDVLNAFSDLQAAEKGLEKARLAQDYANQRTKTEQRKYELGVGDIFFVLDAQTQQNIAQTQFLAQQIQMRRSLITLALAMGDLLKDRNIDLKDPKGFSLN